MPLRHAAFAAISPATEAMPSFRRRRCYAAECRLFALRHAADYAASLAFVMFSYAA